MYRRHAIALLAGAFFAAFLALPALAQVANAPSSPSPRWEILASCAAAYLANVQNRQSDPDRTPAMGAMIQDIFEQYKLAAIAYYEKAVKANVERFIAMDKAGTLEGYIDKCPQAEEPN